MVRKICLLALFAGLSLSSSAQTEVIPCYTHEAYLINSARYPGYKQAVDKVMQQARTYGSKSFAKTSGKGDTIFRIPVVFHIVYNNPQENLDDSLVHNQLKVLNDHFNRRHADTASTREIFKPFAASCRIEFYLATHDPDSNPTTGILRKSTNVNSFVTTFQTNYLDQCDNIKKSSSGGDDAWDPERYLNIWSGDISNNGTVFLLGYAYPPADLDNWNPGSSAPLKALEGVVLHYSVVGVGNKNNTVSLGRTAIHEVGHYLGLRHTWGDDPSCAADDFIDDTPSMTSNSQSSVGNCRLSKNTCNQSDPNDLPDMIENYMDYSPEPCQNMFTGQQSNFMRNVLRISRPNLAQLVITKEPEPPVVYAKPFTFSIKPNPADAEMKIVFEGVQEENVNILITDITGRNVLTITLEKGMSEYTLNLAPLSNGFYYIQTTGSKTSKAVKFVKTETI